MGLLYTENGLTEQKKNKTKRETHTRVLKTNTSAGQSLLLLGLHKKKKKNPEKQLKPNTISGGTEQSGLRIFVVRSPRTWSRVLFIYIYILNCYEILASEMTQPTCSMIPPRKSVASFHRRRFIIFIASQLWTLLILFQITTDLNYCIELDY